MCIYVHIYIYRLTHRREPPGQFGSSAALSAVQPSSFSLLLQDVDSDGQSYTLSGLRKNTEYSFRVVANNKHGPGVSTEDVVVRTLSDGQWRSSLIYTHAVNTKCLACSKNKNRKVHELTR